MYDKRYKIFKVKKKESRLNQVFGLFPSTTEFSLKEYPIEYPQSYESFLLKKEKEGLQSIPISSDLMLFILDKLYEKKYFLKNIKFEQDDEDFSSEIVSIIEKANKKEQKQANSKMKELVRKKILDIFEITVKKERKFTQLSIKSSGIVDLRQKNEEEADQVNLLTDILNCYEKK